MRTVLGREKKGENSTGLRAGIGQKTEGWSKGCWPGWRPGVRKRTRGIVQGGEKVQKSEVRNLDRCG